MSPPEVSALDKTFRLCESVIHSPPASLPPLSYNQKLSVYAKYQQATLGPVPLSARPGLLSFSARAKYDAWAAVGNLSPQDAKRQYIDLVTRALAKFSGVPDVDSVLLQLGYTPTSVDQGSDSDFSEAEAEAADIAEAENPIQGEYDTLSTASLPLPPEPEPAPVIHPAVQQALIALNSRVNQLQETLNLRDLALDSLREGRGSGSASSSPVLKAIANFRYMFSLIFSRPQESVWALPKIIRDLIVIVVVARFLMRSFRMPFKAVMYKVARRIR